MLHPTNSTYSIDCGTGLLNRLWNWTPPTTSSHWISAILPCLTIVDWKWHSTKYTWSHLIMSNLSILWEADAIDSFTLQKQIPSYAMTSRLLHQSTSSFFLGQPEAGEGGSHTSCCMLWHYLGSGAFNSPVRCPTNFNLPTGCLNRLGKSVALKKMNRSHCTTAFRSPFVGSSQLGLMINSSPTESFISQVQWNDQSLNVDMV